VGCSSTALIAVVDDDAAVCQAINSLLRSAGYRCATFESAEAFLTSGLTYNIDCILLDVRMPGMSGLDLHLMLERLNIRIPAICVTATYDGASRTRALSQGAVGFLTKPFEEEDLLDAIHAALNGSGPNGHNLPTRPK
jgi:FixJ family two-component response regulator